MECSGISPTIAEAVDIPIIIYNVPSRTGINLKPELTAELAKLDNIVGIKEASGSLDQITRIIELTKDEDFDVISGDDGLTLSDTINWRKRRHLSCCERSPETCSFPWSKLFDMETGKEQENSI